MALIKCPECGREISDKAAYCPTCGCPVAATQTAPPVDRSKDIEKWLNLAMAGIQGKNSEQVEKYCSLALEIDPENSRAWELEARGLNFNASLKTNRIPQAINAAANAVNFTKENKGELAVSLYDSICTHVNGLLNIALGMPFMYATGYVTLCMGYYGKLLTDIPCLPKTKIMSELETLKQADDKSRKAIMPNKRLIYASHAGAPAWHEQFTTILKTRGIL